MQTVTLDDSEFAVFQLMDLIQRMQKAIDFHLDATVPDETAINQYLEQRDRYRSELAEILKPVPYSFRMNRIKSASYKQKMGV